jgi:hypothetical protein
LVATQSILTFGAPSKASVSGPRIDGAASTWTPITNGAAPGGVLTWTPLPGLRAMVLAGNAPLAARIALSVRTDHSVPVSLPFTVPRPTGLVLSGTSVTRYTNGDYFGTLSLIQPKDTRPFPSELQLWLAEDTLKTHNGAPNATLGGRPARLSDGPPQQGVNIQLQLESGPVAGDFDYAQSGRELLIRAPTIALVESIQPVKNPRDVRNWTKRYLR